MYFINDKFLLKLTSNIYLFDIILIYIIVCSIHAKYLA